jgi:hypothetical protein
MNWEVGRSLSVRLATSLTAALLDGLFEHPEIIEAFVPSVIFQQCLMDDPCFPAGC